MRRRSAALVLAALVAAAGPCAGSPCQPQTTEFGAMHEDEVVVRGDGEREVRIVTRVADERSERAAGYQHICPQTIEGTTILFLFGRPVRSAFHMYNVHAPLDIAFIGDDGSINEILRMEPYQLASRKQPVYRPRQAFIAALEARAGFFADMGIRVGDRFVSLPSRTAPPSR